MADMDEGSKGGRRSVLAFGIVAAIMTVLLIGIGVAGKNVAPNTAQLNVSRPQPAARRTRNQAPRLLKPEGGAVQNGCSTWR